MTKMAKLPVGYLGMTDAEYEALPIETWRAIFSKMRDIIRYTMGTKRGDLAIRCAGMPSTPIEWLRACKMVVCCCDRCKGTGVYKWGACINGRMTHSGPCNRCAGKGVMNFDDMRRCKAYDNYAICKACRA